MARSEETRERVAGVGQRNAIRRALRREAAWRRRRNVVLLKVFIENQFRLKTTADTVRSPPATSGTGVLDGVDNNCRSGSGNGSGPVADHGTCKPEGRIHRTNAGPATKLVKTAAVTAVEGAGCGDGMWSLQGTLERLVDLAGREEALFRQTVLFL